MKNEAISHQTKERLAASLKRAMQKKPFDRITVKELLDDCDISRPTFYYHFEDIYDLMKWMFETEMVELLAKSEDCFTWDEGILLLLQYAVDNKAVCLCAYNSVGYDELRRIFYESVSGMLRRFVNVLLTDIPAKPEHIEFIIEFYTSAFASTCLSWLKGGAKESPEQMIALYEIAAFGTIREALERSAAQR